MANSRPLDRCRLALHRVGHVAAMALFLSAEAVAQFPAEIELSSLDGTDGFAISGLVTDDIEHFIAVSGAGDLNEDGVQDFVIGVPAASPDGRTSAGQTYVVFGGRGLGASGELAVGSLDGANGFVLNGVNPGDYSGVSVSDAGDVNSDGASDLIIGAYQASPNGEALAGASYVVYGGNGIGSAGELELSNLNVANGFVINGVQALDHSGLSVSNAGDVNADGIDDIAIGGFAPDGFGFVNPSESYVVFGAPDNAATGVLELAGLDGSNGFVMHQPEKQDDARLVVSDAGDVNDDGIGDLIVGAPWIHESYVVFGDPGVGLSGSLDLRNLDGEKGFLLRGFDSNLRTARDVSNAGDINADGIDDLIVGSPSIAGRARGASYVVFGGSSVGAGGEVDLSSLDGSNGFTIAELNGDLLGVSISVAGDINGDGIDDLVIGAPRADPSGGEDAGVAYVVFGRAGIGSGGTLRVEDLDGDNGFAINGVETRDALGWTVSDAGDVNDDGVDDLILGTGGLSRGDGMSDAYVIFGRRAVPEPSTAALLAAATIAGAAVRRTAKVA